MSNNAVIYRLAVTFCLLVLTLPLFATFFRIWRFGSDPAVETQRDAEKMAELQQEVESKNEQMRAAGQPGLVGATVIRETWLRVWPQLGKFGTFASHPRLGAAGFLLMLAAVAIALICIWIPARVELTG